MTDPHSELSASLAFIARHLEGEQRRLLRLSEDLVAKAHVDPGTWQALVGRAAYCMQWAFERLRVDADGIPDPTPCDVKVEERTDAEPARAPAAHADAAPVTEALHGNTAIVPLPDVLSLLFGLRKTGLLIVETGRETFEVQLSDGSVTYANSSVAEGYRLGETLVRLSMLGQQELEEVLAAEEDEVLGKILIDKGIITPADLESALRHQMQSVFHKVLELEEARWRFEPGVRRVVTEDVRMNVIHLLLESARAMDERANQKPAAAAVQAEPAVANGERGDEANAAPHADSSDDEHASAEDEPTDAGNAEADSDSNRERDERDSVEDEPKDVALADADGDSSGAPDECDSAADAQTEVGNTEAEGESSGELDERASAENEPTDTAHAETDVESSGELDERASTEDEPTDTAHAETDVGSSGERDEPASAEDERADEANATADGESSDEPDLSESGGEEQSESALSADESDADAVDDDVELTDAVATEPEGALPADSESTANGDEHDREQSAGADDEPAGALPSDADAEDEALSADERREGAN